MQKKCLVCPDLKKDVPDGVDGGDEHPRTQYSGQQQEYSALPSTETSAEPYVSPAGDLFGTAVLFAILLWMWRIGRKPRRVKRFYYRRGLTRQPRRVKENYDWKGFTKKQPSVKKVYYWKNLTNGKVYIGSCNQDKSKKYICSSLFFAWVYTSCPHNFSRRVIEYDSSVRREHAYIWRAWRKLGWKGIYNAQVGRGFYRNWRWGGIDDPLYIRRVLLENRDVDLFTLNWEHKLHFATMKRIANKIICRSLRQYRGSYYR